MAKFKQFPARVLIDFDTVYAGFWLNANREAFGLKEVHTSSSTSFVYLCENMTKEIYDTIKVKKTIHIFPALPHQDL